MVDTERLFLAIALPENVRSCLVERMRVVNARAVKVRWVPAKNIHTTLKFFGDTPAEQKAVIENTMERVVARVQPFDLAIAGVKIVRRGRRPQMVWATVTDSDGELRRLHGRTERLLEQGGFSRERRPLSPHITLARVRDGIAPWEQHMLEEWSLAQRDLAPVPFRVEDVVLMRSELKLRGAEYTVCRRFKLQEK
ncbi:MAG: RNA 2',3'-cyclic phosphodiesterase [Chloroflexi bacterium]|nr:RNA 2',3'-cyclic phosphodiesterase [Chloroflexota bacterium]